MKHLPARLRVALPALFLLLGLAAGGLRATEYALVVGLLLVVVLSRPGGSAATLSPGGEGALVTLLTGIFLVRALQLPTADQPLGTDWFAYLKNAVALAEGDWENWHRWRGPFHAALCVLLTPIAGGLLEASQLLSTLALTLCIPLTALLVRRLAGGVTGVVAAAMLAGWPDLVLFARMSTPYPLLTLLLLVSLGSALAATRDGRWVPVGILALSSMVLTDARGPVLVFTVLASMLVFRPQFRRVGAIAVGVFALTSMVYLFLPVDLVPLSEQIGLQRDLNATALAGVCTVRHGAFPTLAELVDPCARTNFLANLGRAQRVLPVSLAFVAALGVLGVSRATLPLLFPILPALPSLLLVPVQHRYGVPLAPLGAGLAAAAIQTTLRGLPRFSGFAAFVFVGAAIIPWNLFSGSLLARSYGAPVEGDAAHPVILTEDRGLGRVRRLIRAETGAAPVVDCARAGLKMRLFPRPVEEAGTGRADRQPARCRELWRDGADAPTWLLIATFPEEVPNPRWTEVYRWTRADADLVLLRQE